MTRCNPTRDTTAGTATAAFLEYCVQAYGAPVNFSRKRTNFGVTCFHCVCELVDSKHYLNTAYHPSTNEHTERSSKRIVHGLRFYAMNCQADWNQYLQPLAYSQSVQAHQISQKKPSDLFLTRHPPSTTLPGTWNRFGTLALSERLTTVQYKQALTQRLHYTGVGPGSGKLQRKEATKRILTGWSWFR